MKRTLLLICTLLCANVIFAQTFWVGNLQYSVTSTNPPEVSVYDCSSYSSSVTIPPLVSYNNITYSVTSIGTRAFEDCSSLTSIDIPNSVTSIRLWAFDDCSSLTSVTIPNSVTSIGVQAFRGCSSLTTLNFNAINCEDFNSYSDFPFYNCSISTINIGNNVQRIPAYFAYGLDYLISITIPNSVTSIGNEAFWNCDGLTSITIPNSVTSIGEGAFGNCDGLTSITIPNSVTTIEKDVFYNCGSLTSVTIPNSVASIGNYAFQYCSSLTSITIPNSVTSIGNKAFYGCSSLTSVTIPNSVTSIGDYAFQYCSSLISISIGNSVASIGSYTFEDCSSLTSVTCLATIPPSIGNYAFHYPNTLTLSVPCVSLDAYSSPTSLWNMFFSDRISGIEYNVEVSVNNDDFGSVAIENNCSTATLTATATACYQFVGWNDGNTENPRIVTLSSDTTLTANFGVIVNDIITSICQGQVYNENGFNVSEAGVYTQTLTSVNGCDSIVTLILNVNPIYNTELSATICEGQVYTENGFNISEAGVYTQTLQTINGCDSIVTLTLTVLPSYNINLTATICQGSELNISGFNVTEGGVYTQNLTSINGCDSIVTLTVTELPIIHTDLTLTICEGTSLNFSGFNVSEAGVYTQTHTSVNGCDSVVTLTVTELPIIHTDLTLSICEGTTLNFSGFNVSEAGTYTQTHTAANGCDSIVTLVVTTYPTFDTTITATINAGEMYSEFGFNESEAGTYVQNLQTEFGCDSTITLVLSVNSSLLEAEIEEISFYPNPTDSKITFSQAIEKVEVIDLTGKAIFTFSNAKTINLESLPSGAYYLRLTNNDKAIMQKVIKQ